MFHQLCNFLLATLLGGSLLRNGEDLAVMYSELRQTGVCLWCDGCENEDPRQRKRDGIPGHISKCAQK